MTVCLYFKIKDHKDPDRAHGLFTALVAVLQRIVLRMRKGRTVCSKSVYLEEAGAKVPAKQGTMNVAIVLFQSLKSIIS